MNWLDRFAINQGTVGWTVSFDDFLRAASEGGARGVALWSDHWGHLTASDVRRRIADHGLSITALNRGGFFPAIDPSDRALAIDKSRALLDLAAEVGAPNLLIVPGGLPNGSVDLTGARQQVQDALHCLSEHARSVGVRMALEPFHPYFAGTRGVVCTLRDALDICEAVGDTMGVIVDVYHVWWDPELRSQIQRAGSDWIVGYHVCDWKPVQSDPVFDRAMMGDGCADVTLISNAVLESGYKGLVEVEVFSADDLWKRSADAVVALSRERFETHTI